MRVKPPGEGAPPGGVDRAEEVGSTDAAPAAATSSPVSSIDAAAPASATSPTDPVGDVARRLRAGEISARDALELLIDDVIARQVGRAVGDKQALAADLKELLRHHAENDPYLASKMRRLGNRS